MQRLLTCLRWISATAIVLALLLLAWQCLDIYMDGNSPENIDVNGVYLNSVYNMDDVAGRLKKLFLPLTTCIVVVLATMILHSILFVQKREIDMIPPEIRLRLLKTRIDKLPPAASTEEHRRFLIRIICGIVIAGCIVFSLSYLLQKHHFTSWDLEKVISSMMLHILPWGCFAFAAAIVATMLCKASICRELDALKGVQLNKEPEAVCKKGSHSGVLRFLLYSVAIVFIVLGVMNGGLRDVLVKAINICTECIGLG